MGLLVHVEAFVEQPVIAEHVTVIRGHHDDGVVAVPGALQRLQHSAHLVVDEAAVAPVGGDHPLPVGPGQVGGVPAHQFLLLDQRLAGEPFVEVVWPRNLGGIVPGVVRLRHGVREVRSEERGGDQKGGAPVAEGVDYLDRAVRRPRFLGLLGGQRVAPREGRRPAPLQALHLVAGEVVVRHVQGAPPLGERVPAMHAPQRAVALPRQMPLARVADPVAGVGEPGEQRGLADELVVEHPVEVAHVGQLPVVVRIAAGQQRGARWSTQRDRRVGIAEAHPRRTHRVHGRRAAHRCAVAAQGVVTKLVGQQYENIWQLSHLSATGTAAARHRRLRWHAMSWVGVLPR